MGEYEAKTPYERHLIDQLAAANARAENAEARSNELAVFLDEVYLLNRSLIRARDAAALAAPAAGEEGRR